MNQIPLEQIRSGIVNELAARKLIGIAAEKAKLDKDPAVKQQLDAAREQVLQHAYLEKKVRAEVTEATLKARYEQPLKSQTPAEEANARHILVPTEAETTTKERRVGRGCVRKGRNR